MKIYKHCQRYYNRKWYLPGLNSKQSDLYSLLMEKHKTPLKKAGHTVMWNLIHHHHLSHSNPNLQGYRMMKSNFVGRLWGTQKWSASWGRRFKIISEWYYKRKSHEVTLSFWFSWMAWNNKLTARWNSQMLVDKNCTKKKFT